MDFTNTSLMNDGRHMVEEKAVAVAAKKNMYM